MLEDRGASVIMQHQADFYVALQVVLELGSVSLIERLVQLKSKDIPSHILGHALLTAIREGRDEVAKILFDAGANVCAHPVHELPLLEALKRRNGALIIVLSLLDADADCNIGHHSAKGGGTEKSPIQYAVEWGHRSVIEALIFARANVNACGLKSPDPAAALSIAVKQQDRVLTQLLVDAGADIDNPVVRTYGGTAPEVAMANGDTEMARYLLDQGADPNDSLAFQIASLKDKGLFHLLFEKNSVRYPGNRGDFGTYILAQTIAEGSCWI